MKSLPYFRNFLRCFVLITLVLNAAGADFIVDREEVKVTSTPEVQATFTVRLTDIAEVTKVQANIGGKDAPATFKPVNEGKTLIYYLIDVSQPKGGGYIKEETDAVRDMADSLLSDAKSQTLYQVGIGTIGSGHRNFGYSLTEKPARAAILDKIAKQKPDPTSEIYRSALEALEQLKAQSGVERKVLYILSSGISTDTDKSKNSAQALITAANKEAIPVFVIGFTKDVGGQSIWQELRRVAQETGGGFIEATTSSNFRPSSPNAELFGRLKASAVIEVKLKDVAAGKKLLVVNVDLNSGKKFKVLDREIDVPAINSAPTPDPTIPTPIPSPTPGKNDDAKLTSRPWFVPVIVGGGLLIFGLLAFLIYKATRSPETNTIPEPFPFPESDPFPPEHGAITGPDGGFEPTRLVIGWLEEYDEHEQLVKRHEITQGNFSIGRGADSSLRLLESSVSMAHAIIHRRSDRSFEITDLRSANKTRVNSKTIEHCVLKDGDKILIGEVRLKLVLNSSEV